MTAIVESAIEAEPVDLDKTALRGARDARRGGEVAHTRRIDDGRGGARLQPVPAGGGRGMPALGVAGQRGDLRGRIRRQRIDDRGLADAGLADQQGHPIGERPAKVRDSGARQRGHFAAFEVQGAKVGELGLDRFPCQIGFVDDQHRRDLLQMRTRPVPVDQEPVRVGLRRHHDRQPVDIGGDGLGAAPRIDAFDQVAARLDRFNGRAVGRRSMDPRDPIAAHGALFPSRKGAVHRALFGLHQNAAAVAGEDDPAAAHACQFNRSVNMRVLRSETR